MNFVGKALFKTDKVVKEPWKYTERTLTDQDKEALSKLGIYPKPEAVPRQQPAYDRVVLLILESVHRDYIHYYNSNIPAETTPYLDSLLKRYPKVDHYYSSAVPTTQGLNATFRSQLIYDGDLPGENPAVPVPALCRGRATPAISSAPPAGTTTMSTGSIRPNLAWNITWPRKTLPVWATRVLAAGAFTMM